jgi:hypothetical protein
MTWVDNGEELGKYSANLPCRADSFQCATNGSYLYDYQVCDGDADCPDGSDEVGC